MAKDPSNAAMGDDHRRRVEGREPFADAAGHKLVAFAARRHKAPDIRPAPDDDVRLALGEFLIGAKGFLVGTDLRRSIWRAVVADEFRAAPFVPIFALAYENHEDPEMRPYVHPIDPERREELIPGMTAALKRLYDDFEE